MQDSAACRFQSLQRRLADGPMTALSDIAYQTSISPDCRETFDVSQVLSSCPISNDLLDVEYDWNRVSVPSSLREFERRWSTRYEPLDFSGVWRFRELLPFAPENQIVTIGEGQTILQQSDAIGKYVGLRAGQLHLQYEGLNPSGSFKDNGMTAASTHARMVGAKIAACASTGNTSASLAIYAVSRGCSRCLSSWAAARSPMENCPRRSITERSPCRFRAISTMP